MGRVLGALARRYDVTRFRRVHGPDPFRILVGCLISLRTKDEVTYPATERLFALAQSPAAMLGLRAATIARAIYPAGFYRRKAAQLRAISRLLMERHGGRVPETIDALLELPGVGRKTANLVVTLGFGKPGICVDTHVHRITNRLGWVRTRTPHDTERVLRERLPRRHWIPINEILVRHGQQVCKPLSPLCSSCPVRPDCARAGVARSR
ncbi:MAG TPA: endonuclease III [Candidatus Polarisedimenticolaceae bacterium]|nr:endonuclease III [Candidatus Polarisedimenticolaceae bacterium]